MCKIYLIAEMTRYIFVNNLKFIEPVMSLDSRDKQKQGRAALSPPPAPENMALMNIFTTFFVTSRLHEQFGVCENFSFVTKNLTRQLFSKYISLKNWPIFLVYTCEKELSHKIASLKLQYLYHYSRDLV